MTSNLLSRVAADGHSNRHLRLLAAQDGLFGGLLLPKMQAPQRRGETLAGEGAGSVPR